jgi:hypothetical protein
VVGIWSYRKQISFLVQLMGCFDGAGSIYIYTALHTVYSTVCWVFSLLFVVGDQPSQTTSVSTASMPVVTDTCYTAVIISTR